MLCGRDRVLRTLCLAARGWQDKSSSTTGILGHSSSCRCPQAAAAGKEDFLGQQQLPPEPCRTQRTLQRPEEVSDCPSSPGSLGKGHFRSFSHVVRRFKGNLQQDPGECTVVSLISVPDKAGKS